jgi:hypothetical protein
MTYRTVEVEIDHGKVVPKDPEKLPQTGTGLLTILTAPQHSEMPVRRRAKWPIIHCKPGTKIDPSPEELDASLWD